MVDFGRPLRRRPRVDIREHCEVLPGDAGRGCKEAWLQFAAALNMEEECIRESLFEAWESTVERCRDLEELESPTAAYFCEDIAGALHDEYVEVLFA